MVVPEDLRNIIGPVVSQMGCELVGVEFAQRGRSALLRVYIDKPAGITIDDCERVSHQISGVLDVEDPIKGAYQLEVSSPGLDRPLFLPAHYEKAIGETVNIKTRLPVEGRRKFKGVIVSYISDTVTMTVDGKNFSIPFDSIEKANLVPKY